MAYRRLPFAQYFINTSEDFNATRHSTVKVRYTAVNYVNGRLDKLLGLQREVNYEIHYEPDRDVIQINFQRTIGFSDWLVNFEFPSKYYSAIDFEGEPLQLRVHRGWGRMYRTIKDEVREKWCELHETYPTAETEVVGWSLGSGQAILCCQDLNYNYGIRPHLFTFGSVRPFRTRRSNRALTRRYLDSLCAECWNFADINDIVTYMPPFKGFDMIRRVEVSREDKRTVRRLFDPATYHTGYDNAALYAGLPKPEEEQASADSAP